MEQKNFRKFLSKLDSKDIDKVQKLVKAIADFQKLVDEMPFKSPAENTKAIAEQYEKVKHLASDIPDEPMPVAPESEMIH